MLLLLLLLLEAELPRLVVVLLLSLPRLLLLGCVLLLEEQPHRHQGWRFVLGCACFLLGLALNVHSDAILRNLRRPGETGYKIPRGGWWLWRSRRRVGGDAMVVLALPVVLLLKAAASHACHIVL